MKILIIDDDVSAATTLKALLMSRDDLEMEVAYSGKEGLDKMMMADPEYDVLILDVMMPDFSGLDVCKAMHLNQKMKNIPVILSSALPIASETLKDLLKEFETFSTIIGVLEKPFVLDELLKQVDKVEKKS
jgi:two-component system phosphate regulon response regulator PhoB